MFWQQALSNLLFPTFHHDNSPKKKLGVQNQVANYWYGNWKPQRKLWAAQSCTLWMMVDADVVGGAELWLNNSSYTHCLWWNKDHLRPHAWSFIWNSEKSSMSKTMTRHITSWHRFGCSTSIDCCWKWQHGILLQHANSTLALFCQCIQRVSPQRSTPQRCTLAGAPQYLLHIMHFSKSCCEHHSWSCPDASGKLVVMHH